MADAYALLLDWIRDVYRLEAAEMLLEWDQETKMPARGTTGRAETWSALAALKHERLASPQIADWLDRIESTADDERTANLREIRRAHERATRVPAPLVRQITETSSRARDAWATARRDKAFVPFAPFLERMVSLKREQAHALGFSDEPYDALLDEYEPAATTAGLKPVFAAMRERLVPLVRTLQAAPSAPDTAVLRRHYPAAGQEQLARLLVASIGFDFDAGRLDTSLHPFCTGMHPRDVRITTRFDESFFSTAIFGTLHEAGHGLYEQGLDPEHAYTPLGRAVSLGIHESQSRLWENQVGRSRGFWEHHYPVAQRIFPESLGDVALDTFVGAINHVAPSCIRIEADEVTYNLHIMLRFDLECDLIAGKLSPADVPDAWNAGMRDLLGIEPPDDSEGCLQDIHWSMGLFGYFPTYTLGNLHAAQMHAAAVEALGDLDDMLRQGRFDPLRDWLGEHVHRPGSRYTPGDLCERVTGSPLSAEPFLHYIETKVRGVYGLS